MMTDSEIQAIEARCEKATPGPWEVRKDHGNHWGMREVLGPVLRILGFTIAIDISFEQGQQVENDADCIAHARTDIPALLEHIRQLPQWHDRPTGPGLWFDQLNDVLLEVDQDDMDRTSRLGWPFGRVFGPIPADEKGAETE